MKTAKRLSTENRSQIEQVVNPQLVRMLEEREGLEDAAKRFRTLDKRVKELLQENDAPTIVIGPFIVQITNKERKRFDYPQAVQDRWECRPLQFKVVSISRKDQS